MLAHDGSHILHTAIAYFNVVLVEKGVNTFLDNTNITQSHPPQSHSPHSSVFHDLIDQAYSSRKLKTCFLRANSYIFTITVTIRAPSLVDSNG